MTIKYSCFRNILQLTSCRALACFPSFTLMTGKEYTIIFRPHDTSYSFVTTTTPCYIKVRWSLSENGWSAPHDHRRLEFFVPKFCIEEELVPNAFFYFSRRWSLIMATVVAFFSHNFGSKHISIPYMLLQAQYIRSIEKSHYMTL